MVDVHIEVLSERQTTPSQVLWRIVQQLKKHNNYIGSYLVDLKTVMLKGKRLTHKASYLVDPELQQTLSFLLTLRSSFITSHVSSRGYKNGAVHLCVCLSVC